MKYILILWFSHVEHLLHFQFGWFSSWTSNHCSYLWWWAIPKICVYFILRFYSNMLAIYSLLQYVKLVKNCNLNIAWWRVVFGPHCSKCKSISNSLHVNHPIIMTKLWCRIAYELMSPSWISQCFMKVFRRWNCSPQNMHTYGLSMARCSSRPFCTSHAFPGISHCKCIFPVW